MKILNKALYFLHPKYKINFNNDGSAVDIYAYGYECLLFAVYENLFGECEYTNIDFINYYKSYDIISILDIEPTINFYFAVINSVKLFL